MDSKDYRLTIGYTYYDEPELLKNQIDHWLRFPSEIQIILVDDGSQKYPAYDFLKDLDIPNFQLWQVEKDLGFNSHGCRNLIAKIAPTDFILFMDIDCLISPDQVGYLKRVRFNPEKMYRFAMMDSSNNKYHPWPGHLNVFLVNKHKYWEAGGYDESFTGWHKGDREFHRRLHKVVRPAKLTNSLGITVVRGGRKAVLDPSLNRTVYDDDAMLIRLPKKPPKEKDIVGTIEEKINFPYTRKL